MSESASEAVSTSPPRALQVLVGRYDRAAFEPQGGGARVRLAVAGGDAWDALLERGAARLARPDGDADATLTADARTWAAIADDVRGGMRAFRSGRLAVRRNLHVGVGFLAATSGVSEPGRLRFRTVVTRRARLSTLEAGIGPPVLAIHGLGATKGSFLFTVAALADRFRVDRRRPSGVRRLRQADRRGVRRPLLRRRDDRPAGRARARPRRSDRQQPRRPRRARGRPARSRARRSPGTARALVGLATAPSVGTGAAAGATGAGPGADSPRAGRAGDRAPPHPGRRRRLDGGGRRRVPARLSHPRRARRVLRGRAPDLPRGSPTARDGFWPRLRELQPDALFIWGRRDTLVPIAFARHVAEALPQARHVELDCGHVPQMERPGQTHKAVAAFLAE